MNGAWESGSLRRALALARLNEITQEDGVEAPFGACFRQGAGYLLGKENDLPDARGIFGAFLRMLPWGRRALEAERDMGTVTLETFIGFYNLFERGVPDAAAQRQFLYWPVFDYAEIYLPERIREMFHPAGEALIGAPDEKAREMVERYRKRHPEKKGLLISGEENAFYRSVVRAAKDAGLSPCAPEKKACPLLGILGMCGRGNVQSVNLDLRYLLDARLSARMTDVCAETLRGRQMPVGTLYVNESPVFPEAPDIRSLWDREKSVFQGHKIDL